MHLSCSHLCHLSLPLFLDNLINNGGFVLQQRRDTFLKLSVCLSVALSLSLSFSLSLSSSLIHHRVLWQEINQVRGYGFGAQFFFNFFLLCQAMVPCCMWTQVSFAVCTQHKVCPVIGKEDKKAGALVVCIDGWTCHEPMQGLLRRVVIPTRAWLLKSWRFRAWTTKRNVKFEKWREQSLPRETAPQPTTNVHLRSVACNRGWFLTAPLCF